MQCSRWCVGLRKADAVGMKRYYRHLSAAIEVSRTFDESPDLGILKICVASYVLWTLRAILAGTGFRMLIDITSANLAKTRRSFWMHSAPAGKLRALPALTRPGLFAD